MLRLAGKLPSIPFYPFARDRPNERLPNARETVDALFLRYRAYARRVRYLLYIAGVLHTRARPAVYTYVSGFVIILMSFCQCFLVLNFSRDHTDNLILMFKCFGMCFSYIAPALMASSFLVKRKKLIELSETLNVLVERELIRDRTTLAILHQFDVLSYLMTCLSLAAALFLLPSLISIVRQIARHVEPNYRLAMPAKFPWSVPPSGLVFYLHLAYQWLTFAWITLIIGSVDCLFGFYTFQISFVLRAMRHTLTNPRPKCVFADILRECTQTHHQIERCASMLEDIWGVIVFRVIIANSILICALIFEATTATNMTAGEIFLIIFYMGHKLAQTFIYSWFGSLVTSASENFREGIYFSEWPNVRLDRHLRANLVITMMQKPLTLTALKITSVNVNMFINIVNTAVSYYFLLVSVNERG